MVIGITSPNLNVPLLTVLVTPVIVGNTLSIIIALFAPSEPEAAGDGKVNDASEVPPVSLIVPPFNANELVAL